MRYPPLVALTIGALLSAVPGTSAHVGDRVYPLLELTDDMLALIDLTDGKVDDWFDVVGEPTLVNSDLSFTLDTDGQEYGSGDLNFSVWLAWHRASNRILVGSVFIDDVHLNEFAAAGDPFSSSDSIFLLIDGDHSGPPYGDQEPDLLNSGAQMFGAIPEGPEGPPLELTVSSQIGKPGWMLALPYSEGGGRVAGVHPVVWSIEFAVTPFDLIVWDDPERSRISDLEAGAIVGLGVFILDHDAPNGGDLILHSLPGTSYLEGLAADGLLLDAEGGDVGSAIESISWGRIKAAL